MIRMFTRYFMLETLNFGANAGLYFGYFGPRFEGTFEAIGMLDAHRGVQNTYTQLVLRSQIENSGFTCLESDV